MACSGTALLFYFWVLAPCRLVSKYLGLKVETLYLRNGIYRRVYTAPRPRRIASTDKQFENAIHYKLTISADHEIVLT
jgi:hypothetical protein